MPKLKNLKIKFFICIIQILGLNNLSANSDKIKDSDRTERPKNQSGKWFCEIWL